MIYDCFMSYYHKDVEFVEKLVNSLEQHGLKCWYAPRNISGRYAKAISDAISNSKIFILILTSKSAVSEEVLNEVELAHNIEKKGGYAKIQPLYIETFDFDSPLYHEMMYYIRRIQFIITSHNMSFEEISESIISSRLELKPQVERRQQSNYITQQKEDIRIRRQNFLLDKFDNSIYTSVVNKYKNSFILDIGCSTGEMMIPKIQHNDYCIYVGFDKSSRQIEIGRKQFVSKRIIFIQQDIEEESFEHKLRNYMENYHIPHFDIINISMVLLHLENPTKLLKVLSSVISLKGTIIIRDIDDGLNFAFPDTNQDFDRIYRICDHDEQSGFRKMGRQIYHDLISSGFKHITLEKQGLSTIGMSDEDKETMFQLYFPFTLENAKIMYEKYPYNKELEQDYFWFKDCYNEIHDRFMKPDFVFSLGFQTYTANL